MTIVPANVHIEVKGSGPSLVLLHGWGMSGVVWQPLIKKLSNFFTLHIVDLPGMGLSRPTEPYHLHSIAEKIAEMLPAHVDILGWSWGGQVAMRIALNYPKTVRSLVLVDSTPCFVNKENLAAQAPWTQGISAEVFRNFAHSMDLNYHKTLTQFLTLQCMGDINARLTIRLLRKKLEERPAPTQQILRQALNILIDTDLRLEIEHLRKPILLIHGDKDTLVPVQAAHWMMQNLPTAYLRVIAGASHAPFLSHQASFLEAVIQFLGPSSV